MLDLVVEAIAWLAWLLPLLFLHIYSRLLPYATPVLIVGGYLAAPFQFYYECIRRRSDEEPTVWEILTGKVDGDPHPRMQQREFTNGYDARYMILTAYMIYPWHAYWFDSLDPSKREVIGRVLPMVFWSVYSLLKTPYDYLEDRPKEPPDGYFGAALAISLVLLSFGICTTIGLYRIIGLRLGWIKLPDDDVCDDVHGQDKKPVVLATIASLASDDIQQEGHYESFDTDSMTMVMDNSATGFIFNDKRLIKGELRPVESGDAVATIGGVDNRPEGQADLELRWADDSGKVHTYLIENAFYFPQSPVNVFSVTKFAEMLGDDDDTFISTRNKYSVFQWDFGKYSRRFNHSARGLPELPINEGFGYFDSFCLILGNFYGCLPCSMASIQSTAPTGPDLAIVTDDEGADADDESESESESDLDFSSGPGTEETREPQRSAPAPPDQDTSEPDASAREAPCGAPACKGGSPGINVWGNLTLGQTLIDVSDGKSRFCKLIDVDLDSEFNQEYFVEYKDGSQARVQRDLLKTREELDIASIPVSAEDYEQESAQLSPEKLAEIATPQQLDADQQLLLSWHYRLGHLGFSNLLKLANIGVLPRRLRKLKDRLPKCIACEFGLAHRRNWRTKGNKNQSIRKESDNKPGACTSVDQLISAQPGLVPTVSGTLASFRITAATVFVDHFMNFIYVHLMRSTTQDETIVAKLAYEKLAASYGVDVRAYRADNGRFAESRFREAVEDANQSITFCGVGAHHQNAIAERAIKELTLAGRTLLLHAKRHWPEMITTMLWPFALKMAAERQNFIRIDDEGRTAAAKFSGIDMPLELRHHHTFGCPVYVLDGRLQSGGGSVPKWEPRSRMGVYLGHSPVHAGSVALVLPLQSERGPFVGKGPKHAAPFVAAAFQIRSGD